MTDISDAKRVVIVGGGLAGLAAAEALSRHMSETQIVLLEAKRTSGGRAGSFRDQQSGEDIDYCQHVAMGCCTNWIDFAKQCGLNDHVRRYRELVFLHPDHPPSPFVADRLLPPPLHLVRTIAAQRYLSKRQKREIRAGLWTLMRTTESSLRNVTASDWLRSVGQSTETVRDFWEVILVSALGERPQQVAMSSARKVLIDGFAAARGASDVLVPTRPLSELFGERVPAELRRRGVEIRCGEPARRIEPDGRVHTDEDSFTADQVIAAVPWYRVHSLFSGWPADAKSALPRFDVFERFSTSPITGLHLWFDRPITDRPHAVLVGTTSQWLFRDPITSAHPFPSGTGASAAYQGNQPAESQGQEHYYQVVLSASSEVAAEREELVEIVRRELADAFPDARRAILLRARVVTDPKSVFSISPEVDAVRPATETKLDWLKLAGDWVATGWPSTMEGAVISGRMAAEAVHGSLVGGDSSAGNVSFVLPGLTRGWLARCLIRA
ncbi:MAG: hydroxysqualene dehydroxylase HpnE [Planctomycetota bacterium]